MYQQVKLERFMICFVYNSSKTLNRYNMFVQGTKLDITRHQINLQTSIRANLTQDCFTIYLESFLNFFKCYNFVSIFLYLTFF